MGFFKELPAEAEKASGDTPGSTRNVALRVKSYDVEKGATTGTDIVTGEEITVSIRALANTYEKQGGIHMWSKPKGKGAVATGDNAGVILFESVIRDPEGGGLTSRWGVVASHNAEEADVSKVYARPAPDFRDRTAACSKRSIEIARVDQAVKVDSEAALKEAMVEILARPFTNAVVRGFDGADGRAAVVWKGKDNTPEQAFDSFRATNTSLGRHLSDDGIGQLKVVEVFPIERLYPGADTKAVLTDMSKLDAKRFERDWSLGDMKGCGFGESMVALRTHGEGGRFFTMMLPAVNRQPLWTLDSLPTAHHKPAVAPILSKETQGSNAPAADAAPTAAAEASAAVAPEAAPAQPAMSEEAVATVSAKIAGAARMFGQRP